MDTAQTLIQALPYIRTFAGKTVVVKYGGNAMIDDEIKVSVMRDLVLMRIVGINPILVHGGGPEISQQLSRVGIESTFVAGRRVTDAATMEVVEMVLSGKANKAIVSMLCREGAPAVGLSGKDANLFIAERDTDHGDIGFVGKITQVNPEIITTLVAAGYIPVVSTIAVGTDGQAYNVNADTAASALAIALQAEKFILMTDVPGVYSRFPDPDSLLSELTTSEARDLITSGVVGAGMIPKLEACIAAVEDGVPRAHILDGRTAHSLLVELFTAQGVGTMVR
jgi:acetylglutamate kinase